MVDVLIRGLWLVAALVIASPASARPTQFPAPDRELMVPVAGGRVYVRVNGRLDGIRLPVIISHGGPGSTHGGLRDWLELTDDRAVILYDQLDSGRSDHPGKTVNWTVGRFVDELDAMRAALGIKRWHVAGHSWGGTVALEYAARRPAALAGVVLASPLVSTKSWIADANFLRTKLAPETQATLTQCETSTPPAKQACDDATDAFYAVFLKRTTMVPPAFKAKRHADDRGFNAVLYNYMWGASEFVSTGTLKSYDGEPLLTRLDGRRTLFMAGQYDEARPETTLRFAGRVKDAEVAVVPGAGHALTFDRPDETIAILRAWLRRQDDMAAQ
jgi:proline iminopeptidase/L-proline amide hydrolase